MASLLANVELTDTFNAWRVRGNESLHRMNLVLPSPNTLSVSNSASFSVSTAVDAVAITQAGAGDALRITQTGTGNALLVEDSANPDSTPFVIDTSGNVGIGKTTPTVELDVIGDIVASGDITSATASFTTVTDLGSVTTCDINGGTIDGVTIGATVAPTVTDLGTVATCDINGGSIDGVTIGAAAAPTVTNLGSVATCDINGGSIDGVTIGATVAPTVTDLGSVATCDINGGSIDGVTIGAAAAPTVTNLGSVATCDINGGSIDGTTIGAGTAAAGTFTTLIGNSITQAVDQSSALTIGRFSSGYGGAKLDTSGSSDFLSFQLEGVEKANLANTGLLTATTFSGSGSSLTDVLLTGTYSIPVAASAMIARATNGSAYGTIETATNKNLADFMLFDPSTQEYAGFTLAMPKGWNEGTVTFHTLWTHPTTTVNFGVVWSLSAVAVGNGDALEAAFGTAQTSTDTGATSDTVYRSPTSSAITIAGTPAAEDMVMFQITRVVGNGSDTLAVDARLHAVVINITYGQNDA
jgi:hypothetical protein